MTYNTDFRCFYFVLIFSFEKFYFLQVTLDISQSPIDFQWGSQKYLGAPLKANGALENIQGNLTSLVNRETQKRSHWVLCFHVRYRQISDIRRTKYQNLNYLVSSCSCLCAIYWSHVLSWVWRCSWSSAARRCSNYIWVINNLIAHKGVTYIRDLTAYEAVRDNMEPLLLKQDNRWYECTVSDLAANWCRGDSRIWLGYLLKPLLQSFSFGLHACRG